MSVHIKKGDKVQVMAGKEKGKSGKVLKVVSNGTRAIVDGLNVVKKHSRRRSEQDTGGIKEIPASINMASLALFCSGCNRGVRYGVQIMEDKTKSRICKKCKQVIS